MAEHEQRRAHAVVDEPPRAPDRVRELGAVAARAARSPCAANHGTATMMTIATHRRHQRRRPAGRRRAAADRHADARDRERDEADRAGGEEQHRVALGREIARARPRASSRARRAPARRRRPPGSSTFAPCSAKPEHQRAPPRHHAVERRPQRAHEPEHRRQRAGRRDRDPPRARRVEALAHLLDPRQRRQQRDRGAADDDEERDALDDAAYVQLMGSIPRSRDRGS